MTEPDDRGSDAAEANNPERFPSLGELRALLSIEFAGNGSRILAIGTLGGLIAVIELVLVVGIAQLGTAMLRGTGDAPIALPLGLETSPSRLAAATVAVVIVRGVLEMFYVIAQSRALAAYELTARSAMLRSFLEAEWPEQIRQPPAQFVNEAYSFLGVSRTTYRRMMDAITAFLSFLVMIAGSFLVGGLWVLAVILGAVAIAAALRPLARRSHIAGVRSRDAAHRFGDAIWESVLLARETRVLGITDTANRRNQRSASFVAEANRSRDQLAGIASSTYTSVLFTIVTGGLLLITLVDVSNPAAIVTVLLLLFRGLGYGRTLQAMYQEIVASEPSIRALQKTRERLEDAHIPSGGPDLEGELSELVFTDVGFSYQDGRPALNGVNVHIHRGEALGVVGPSGAGKTTFVHLMLRLLLPTRGAITVNGLDLAVLDPSSWFGRAVLVTQDARAYEGTVLDNVTCGRPGVTESVARQALRSAHLLDEIEALPNGINTIVSGDRLSGGQRQRLAIARALAGKPDILVLDEPTSALDLISEEAIRQTLAELKGHVTLVIVAHRLSTLRICDRVAVFEHGSMQAVGSREELEADSDFYAEAIRLAKLV